MREFGAHHDTESDFLLDVARLELQAVRLRVKISGEKSSSVEEVWGLIREAQLVEPSASDEDWLAKIGGRLLPDE